MEAELLPEDKLQRIAALNLFLHDTGHHEASWRLPDSDPHANLSLAAHQHLARVAEDAKFDSVIDDAVVSARNQNVRDVGCVRVK